MTVNTDQVSSRRNIPYMNQIVTTACEQSSNILQPAVLCSSALLLKFMKLLQGLEFTHLTILWPAYHHAFNFTASIAQN